LLRILLSVVALSAVLLLVVVAAVPHLTPMAGAIEQIARGLFGSIFYETPILLMTFVALQALGAFGNAYLRGKQQFKQVSQLAASAMVLQIAGVCILGSLYGPAGAIVGYALGPLLPAASALSRLSLRRRPAAALRRRVRRYSGFAWASNVANTFVWARMEIFFLSYFWGDATVGILAVAMSLASLATQPPLLMTSGVLSLLAEQQGRGDQAAMQSAYSTGTTLVAALVLPASFGMAALSPAIVPLVYGAGFAAAVPVAAILVSVAGIAAANSMATNLVYALERSDFVFYTSALGGLISVAAGLVLVPEWGVMGAAIGRCLVQLILVALGAWFVWRRLGFHFSMRSLCCIAFASCCSAAVAGAIILSFTSPLSLAVAVPTAAACYLLLLAGTGAFSQHELAMMSRTARALPRPFAGFGLRLVAFLVAYPRYQVIPGWPRSR
jgi:O-antigen/teichoic acid export membrane protein